MKNPYTISDCGCFVDSARGNYAIDAIYSIAKEHGFTDQDAETFLNGQTEQDCDETLSSWEFSNDLEDDIDSFMNDTFPVDGAYWGRSEQSDWGLWAIEEN